MRGMYFSTNLILVNAVNHLDKYQSDGNLLAILESKNKATILKVNVLHAKLVGFKTIYLQR